ncbi:MAG: L,D-transpeptidase family protein [Gemmatimonadota bacterium]|nr:L,D-transpeptidase family protein [Gemmatimonadota bacterium]
MSARTVVASIALGVALGCAEGPPQNGDDEILLEEADGAAEATVYWAPDTLSEEAIEAGRRDTSWRLVVGDEPRYPEVESLPSTAVLDTAGFATAGPPDTARTADSPPRDTLPRIELPLEGDRDDLSVFHVQVLLDRARFSPGVLDGKWGKNTEKAIYWLQRGEGVEATGTVDSLTYERLVRVAGNPDRYVRTVVLTEEDVAGPFVSIPESPWQQADLACLCYRSVGEKVAERFHATPGMLSRLNPDVVLDSLRAGDSLRVPNVEGIELTDAGEGKAAPGAGEETLASRDTLAGADVARADAGDVARIVISDAGHWLHALDEDGRILYHFPTTLGSQYNPSPEGRLEITSISFDPWFHFQPALFDEVDDSEPDVKLPPGPNSPVGIVWMALSKPHYGIHGTARPETIGYVTSHGCIRLTNWDARFLAERTRTGVPVEFVDLRGRGGEADERRPATR